MGKIPGINNHNSFAKIIKNLFHDDFVFSARSAPATVIAGTKRAKQTQVKMLGLKSLLADSRIPFSNKVENLKNISVDIFIIIRILKNWEG